MILFLKRHSKGFIPFTSILFDEEIRYKIIFNLRFSFLKTDEDSTIDFTFLIVLPLYSSVFIFNQQFQRHSHSRLTQYLQKPATYSLDAALRVDQKVVTVIELKDVCYEMKAGFLDIDLEVQKSRETILLSVDAEHFFEFADGAPGTSLGPIQHNCVVLQLHDFRHETVYRFADDFLVRKPKHLFHVARSRSYNPHHFCVNFRLNRA